MAQESSVPAMTPPGPGDPIPVPPDFPVDWAGAGDEKAFWMLDRMHFPRPLTPLGASLLEVAIGPALAAAMADSPAPMDARMRAINGYMYMAMAPLPPPPDAAERGARQQEELMQMLPRIGEVWENVWLPEVQENLRFWEGFDLDGASQSELIAHLDESIARFKRVWTIHMTVVFPVHLAMQLFDDMYRDLFGDEDRFGAYRLTQGFDNKTLEGDRALWALSRQALAEPAVRSIVEEQAAADVMPALEAEPAATEFLAALQAYLDEYGQRGPDYDEVGEPSWIEDPTPAILRIKDFMGQADRDLAAELDARATEREEAMAAVREQLGSYPEPVVQQFEALLAAAQQSTVLTEVHNFWIDFRSVYRMRRLFLTAGRQLAEAGVIADANDVFYLTIGEVRRSLEDPTADLRALVAKRKAEHRHQGELQAPPALGTMPPGAPPDDPMTRSNMNFFGAPPPPPTDPGTLRGAAGSPGTARGTARVIRSLVDGDKLEIGDILVTEATAPPWSSLFARAAAIVTDTGGILSHCSVVAREYGIPAVVGTGMGTAMIRDGQEIEVDGSTGTIRLLE
ncbi:MAG TPA: PEP-utilizing enzyme [Chloroflexota bacterium]|nr:PEP-utilizing enzyme [Chloroflexota bacterium]